MAAVLEAATVDGLPARVLAEVGGDRRLTDLRHIGEALHEVTLTERHGLVSLLTWLREQVAEAKAGRGLERTRRLDSDAAAVQLVTIHASKGLEYPVVYLPALADRFVGDPKRPRFHDAEEPALPQRRRRRRRLGRPLPPLGRRGGGGVAAAALRRGHPRPVAGRLLVGADQERPRLAAAPDADARRGHQHGRAGAAAAERRRGGRAVRAAGATAAVRCRSRRTRADPGAEPPAPATPGLAVRRFTRTVDTAWRRTSYSSLSKVEAVDRRRGRRDQRARGGRQGRRAARRRRADGWRRRPSRPTTGSTCRRRWPSCRSARRSARWCTRCSSTPTRRPPTSAPSCSATSTTSSAGGRSSSTARSWPTRWSRCPTRRSGRWSAPRCAQIPLSDRLREMDFELPLAGGDVRGRGRRRTPRRPRAAARAAPARGRPGAPLRRGAARPARRAGAARLPHRLGRRRAAGARARATWSSTTRPTGSARSTSRSPPAPTAPRRSTRRWATPTTRCRRCSTPRCCTGSCAGASPATTPSSTSAACSTSTCAACAGRRPRWSTERRAASSPGGRRSPWSRRSPTCSTASSRRSAT